MLEVLLGQFPVVSLRLWSCAGASTTCLGRTHDTNEGHRYLATEILSRILNLRSPVSAAKSEHSTYPMMGRAEKLFWGLRWPDRHHNFHFLPTLDCWNQQILCRGSLHPTIMNLLCRANLTLCAAICLFCIEMSRLVCQWVWQNLHLKRIGRTRGVRCTRPEVYEDIEKGGCARSITLELQELAGSKLVPKRDCAVQRSEVAKL